MIKKYKWNLLVTSIIILLPMLYGLVVWDQLPDVMATHWGMDNQPNGYSSKNMVVFGMPLIMLAMQWFCLVAIELDIRKRNHSPQVVKFVLWIIPLMSLFALAVTYSSAMGAKLNVGFWALFLVGIIFVLTGNYLPKCRQNWTMGVRNRWTLSDPENWNRTHRLAGPVWIVCGLMMIIGGFFSTNVIVAYGMFVPIAVAVLVPTIYSYLYYKKHKSEDE